MKEGPGVVRFDQRVVGEEEGPGVVRFGLQFRRAQVEFVEGLDEGRGGDGGSLSLCGGGSSRGLSIYGVRQVHA
jgi:hypothetical protein